MKIRFARQAGGRALAVGVRPGGKPLPAAGNSELRPMVRRILTGHRSFKAESGDVLPVCTLDGWLVLVGMGAAEDQDGKALRKIGGSLVAELAEGGIVDLAVDLDLGPAEAAEVAYGARLRAWRPPTRYRSKPDPEKEWTLRRLTLVTPEPDAAEKAFGRLAALAEGAAMARDLVVAPGNHLTPPAFVSRLRSLSSLGLTLDLLDPARHGLNLLAAVGRGSAHPPCLAVLQWRGGPSDRKPVALVGKGITFDAGGICIKEAEDMHEMKNDMAGAAAVVGVLRALATCRAEVNVIGVLAIAENLPSGRASRPGDVLRSYAGLTVEIIDTDAEGRLALADALAFTAAIYKPQAMVDLATLTGAVEEALGYHRAGLFTPDDALAANLLAAGEAEDELLWRLPLTDRYDEALESRAADLRNCDWTDGPDAMHAARFLQRFVPAGLPWAHIDIAGLSEAHEDEPLAAEGPTGFGVRLLARLLADHYER